MESNDGRQGERRKGGSRPMGSAPISARWGASAAILGGALFAGLLGAVAPFFEDNHALYHLIELPAYALLAIGGLGVYLRRRDNLGVPSKVGFLLCLAAFVLTAAGSLAIVVTEGVFGTEVAALDAVHLLFLLMIAGSVAFGAGMLRAGGPDRGGALLVVAGSSLFVVLIFSGIEDPLAFALPLVVYGAGWAWLGHALRSTADGSSTEEAAGLAAQGAK